MQGISLVEVVGGVSDIVYQKKITDYAEMKYHRLFLLKNSYKSFKSNDIRKNVSGKVLSDTFFDAFCSTYIDCFHAEFLK